MLKRPLSGLSMIGEAGLALPNVSIAAALRNTRQILAEAGIVDAESDARRLVEAATEHDPSTLLLHADWPITPNQQAWLTGAVERRLRGEPVGRILGSRAFWGLDFSLNHATLEPRPDSETLVDACLTWASKAGRTQEAMQILDLGCGSGCLGLALLSEFPNAECIAVDRSPDAAQCAKTNARQLGMAPRYSAICGNWLDAITGSFDVVVTNPPYIAHGDMAALPSLVRDHDPVLALDGGSDGLSAYREILAGVKVMAQPPTYFAAEIGASQASSVCELFAGYGFGGAVVHSDLAGLPRVVAWAH